MRKAGLVLVGIILIAMFSGFITLPLRSEAYTLDDVDRAINDGIDWILDSIIDVAYDEAVVRDHPSVPIAIRFDTPSGYKWVIAGGTLDPYKQDYWSEIISSSTSSFSMKYYFNADDDWDYDVELTVFLENIDSQTDEVTIIVDKNDAPYPAYIYIGSLYPHVYEIQEGARFTFRITDANRHYWFSSRYVPRHSTMIASYLLEDLGYTTTAQKLRNFMTRRGFIYEIYAPFFDRAKNYPDDYMDRLSETWNGNGYNSLPWIKTSSKVLYPYKSRMYIITALGQASRALDGWKQAPLAKLLKAAFLLDKYGASRASEAESLILDALNEGEWTGDEYSDYGLHRWCVYGFCFNYAGYPTYLTAGLLITVIKYYKTTGDVMIGDYNALVLADRLAGILMQTQWRNGASTVFGNIKLAMFNGGFAASYEVGSEIQAKPSAWGVIDFLTSGIDLFAGLLKEGVGIDTPSILLPMPHEFPVVMVNSESTILAVQALRKYRELNRTPTPPSALIVMTKGKYSETLTDNTGTIDFKADADLGGRYLTVYGSTSSTMIASIIGKYTIKLYSSGNYKILVSGIIRYVIDTIEGTSGEIIIEAYIDTLNHRVIRYVVDSRDSGYYAIGKKTIDLESSPVYLSAGEHTIWVRVYILGQGSTTIDIYHDPNGLLLYFVGVEKV